MMVRQRGSAASATRPCAIRRNGTRRRSLVSGTLRLGLCCQFVGAPIRFHTATATSCSRLSPPARRRKLSRLCLANAAALLAALQYCAEHKIGCFRIISSLLPLKTHPQAGYAVSELPDGDAIVAALRLCGSFAAEHDVRAVFHPDQFVVLSSPREDVVARSIAELEYQAELCQWVGADVINVHGGGAYGDKQAALDRFARNLDKLSHSVRTRLTVENDDRVYPPAELLPLCRAAGIPLVYDVHHHRCLGLSDSWSIARATDEARATWNREPLFHLSSPLGGWRAPHPERHHDYIHPADFPDCWRGLAVTVEIEAKAKELAVLRLQKYLEKSPPGTTHRGRKAADLAPL